MMNHLHEFDARCPAFGSLIALFWTGVAGVVGRPGASERVVLCFLVLFSSPLSFCTPYHQHSYESPRHCGCT